MTNIIKIDSFNSILEEIENLLMAVGLFNNSPYFITLTLSVLVIKLKSR